MKPKNLSKKLELNKITVAQLTKRDIIKVKGGTTSYIYGCVTENPIQCLTIGCGGSYPGCGETRTPFE
ncbi:MAG: class I lanthipeptide [Candidatus Aminicenantes bacterium]|jgi:hypothetical protein